MNDEPKNETGRDGTVLHVEGLTKVFGAGETSVRAVDGVDLSVDRGEIVLVMGPSGSGKTTLLTMIGGILRPTSGSARINGVDLYAMKEAELTKARRHLVGFVFQTFNLLEPLDALENVAVTLNIAGSDGRESGERAEKILSDLGMGHRLRFRPQALSGGEKQRVSIARALANEPQLILADEPTANLDSKHGHDVVTLLRDIAKNQRRAVVIVSHDHRIREVADRVLWLEDGRFKDMARLARDPVCGMSVEESAISAVHNGQKFYFCSNGCRKEFLDDPEKLAGLIRK
jgi:putative ABC transport system ATP-binding protein